MASERKHVTASAIAQVSSCFKYWLENGLKNCALYPRRLEDALLELYKRDQHSPGDVVPTPGPVLRLTTHLMLCCSMLRVLVLDEKDDCRRTRVFRRQSTSQTWSTIKTLMSLVELQKREDDINVGSAMVVSTPTFHLQIPDIFLRDLTVDELKQKYGNADSNEASICCSSVCSTVDWQSEAEAFDDSGFPCLPGVSVDMEARKKVDQAMSSASCAEPCEALLGSRQRKTAITPKPKKRAVASPKGKSHVMKGDALATPKKLARKYAGVPTCKNDLIIVRTSLSITKSGRGELVGYSNDNVRVHVKTLLATQDAKRDKVLRSLKRHIDDKACSKTDALKWFSS